MLKSSVRNILKWNGTQGRDRRIRYGRAECGVNNNFIRKPKTWPKEITSSDKIISVGYRVKSRRGTQFRIWATNILKEYMKKGFAMDDERLKNLGGGGYFKELFLTNRRWIKPQMNIENIRLKRSVMWNGII